MFGARNLLYDARKGADPATEKQAGRKAQTIEDLAKLYLDKFPKLPAVVHPIVRGLLFKRVLRKAVFPKAKTNKAMNPASGPATPAEGRVRLETAH